MSMPSRTFSTSGDILGRVQHTSTVMKKTIRPADGAIRVLDDKHGPVLWNQRVLELLDTLSGNEAKALLRLIFSVNASGQIRYLDSRNKLRLVTNENRLREYLGLSGKSAWYNFKKKAEEYHLFSHVKKTNEEGAIEQYYLVNPVFAVHNSRWITPELAKTFGNDLMPHLQHGKQTLLTEVMETDGNIYDNRSDMSGESSSCLDEDIVIAPPAHSEDSESADEEQLLNESEKRIQELEEANRREDDIFNHYVLNGNNEFHDDKTAITWYFAQYDGKRITRRGSDDTNINVYFAPNRIQEGYRRTKEHVAEYNNCYVDIDVGKDESGNYLPLATVHNRKVELRRSVISKLPRYTALVETRNGFHVYWSLNPDTTTEEWTETELAIVNTLTLSDPAVKDPSRILRMPLSIHKKDGTLPFVVTVADAHEIRYACESLLQEFERHAGAITKACEEYLKDYPEVQAKHQVNRRRTNSDSIPKENNHRITEIMNLSDDDSREKPERQHMTKEEFIEFVHRQDLREFLGVGSSNPFRCVFPDHEDNHPSAGILTSTDGTKQVYYCSCTGKPLDIFDVVQEIAGCDYGTAARYLNRHYNVKITD